MLLLIAVIFLLLFVWWLSWEMSNMGNVERTILLKSIGIGFANFLRVYSIVLVVGGVLSQIEHPYPAAFAPGNIAGTLGAFIGGAIGTSILPTLLGLLIEFGTTWKFESRIFLCVSLSVMIFLPLIDWLVKYFHQHPL